MTSNANQDTSPDTRKMLALKARKKNSYVCNSDLKIAGVHFLLKELVFDLKLLPVFSLLCNLQNQII